MGVSLPPSLSPSSISKFKECPLAFRFSYLDRLPASYADITLPIRITYPSEGKLMLAPNVFGRPLFIEEGLFHALEEAGWLTSYEMRWHTSIAANDPRLRG